jgi:hypothetical protein
MPDLSIDDTDRKLIDSVRKALSDARYQGKAAFIKVEQFVDAEAFVQFANTVDGPLAGLVPSPPERQPPEDNAGDYRARLKCDVIIGLFKSIPMGGDAKEVVDRVDLLVGIARSALLADRFCGGLAQAINWSGKLLRGTDVDGEPRPVRRGPRGDGFLYATRIPVVIGWRKDL